MLQKINHIGIAVQSLDATLPFYRDQLGMPFKGTEEVAEQKVRVAMLGIGEAKIELLEPTSPESPIAKFLEKMGRVSTISPTKCRISSLRSRTCCRKGRG